MYKGRVMSVILYVFSLKDTMTTMFKGRSIAERGTLAQLRNDFGHRNVTTDVMNCFNAAEDFLRYEFENVLPNMFRAMFGQITVSFFSISSEIG